VVPGAFEVVSVPRPGAEQPKKSEFRFHGRDYTLSVYARDILREEDMHEHVLAVGKGYRGD